MRDLTDVQLRKLCIDAMSTGNDVLANSYASIIAERKNLLDDRANVLSDTIDLKGLQGKIAVDIDDTVGSFEDDMRLALARRDGLTMAEALIRYPMNCPNGTASWFDDDANKSYQEFMDLEDRGLLYKDQPVRVGSRDVLNWLYNITNGRVEFLTARPAEFNSVSEEWLRHRVGIDFPIHISNSNKKEQIEDYEILIDDSIPHVKNVVSEDAPYGPRKVVFMTRPRSDDKIESSDYVHRAWSWQDVQRIFGSSSKKFHK